MGQKFHKLNSKYGIIDYPILLKDLESIIQEFPKSERKFYEYAIKASFKKGSWEKGKDFTYDFCRSKAY